MDIEIRSEFASDRLALDRAVTSAWQALHLTPPDRPDVFGFFRALGDVLTAIDAAGRPETVAAVMRHVDYLAGKASISSAALLKGEVFVTHPQYILDALANIAATLRLDPQWVADVSGCLPADVETLIAEAEARLAGWCTREKATCIAETVLAEKPDICVEIGIFGGRSLVPAAAALRRNGRGVIYGVEAWSPVVAVENPTNDANDDWWSTVDFNRVKLEFYRFIADKELTRQVRVIEAASGRAAALFGTIDFLHIDGSHSVLNAAEDVVLYASKVRPGGIIIFDDVNWQSTAPARALLEFLCEPVRMLRDAATGQDVCAVLRRK